MVVEQRLKLLFFCFQGSPACARCSCNIILFIYLYYVLADVYQDVLVGSVRVCVCAYFFIFYYGHRVGVRAGRVRVGAVHFACVCAYILFFNIIIFIYIYLYKPICACVGEFFVLIFENVGVVGGSATPGCSAERLENLEKYPHRRIDAASPTKNR